MSRDLTDALSKLFIKLGGKLSDSKENKGPVDYIDDITGIVEPGGGSIASYFVVNFSYNESTEKFESDKTFDEVKAAYDKDSLILFSSEDIIDFAHYNSDENAFNANLMDISIGEISGGDPSNTYDFYSLSIYWTNSNLQVIPCEAHFEMPKQEN